MSQKIRANSKDANIGAERQKLFSAGFARIDDAIEHHYFLEAICLIESLLADRMESRASDHFEGYRGFDALGPILKRLAKETDPALIQLNAKVDEWRKNRNRIHEVMKIDINSTSTWRTRVSHFKSTALTGRSILRQYDNALRKARRQDSKLLRQEPSASET